MTVRNQQDFFEGRERRKLFYQSWVPEQEEKAHIIALHDLAVYSDRFQFLAEYLGEKDYAVHAYDIRGHYRSKGKILGEIKSMDHLQKDLVLFIDIVEKNTEDKKIFLLGQGFGALISLMYAIRHPDLSGIIACSPEIGLKEDLSTGKKMFKKLSSSLSQTEELNINPNQLTSDLKILKEFIKDKHVLKNITGNTTSEREKLRKWVVKNVSKLSCPTLILQAGDDKIVDVKKTEKFFKNVKSEDKSYKKYDGMLHDILNEKSRAHIFQDVFVWLEKHL